MRALFSLAHHFNHGSDHLHAGSLPTLLHPVWYSCSLNILLARKPIEQEIVYCMPETGSQRRKVCMDPLPFISILHVLRT